MKHIVFILSCTLLLVSCKKDTQIVNEPKPECEPWPSSWVLNPTKTRDNSLNRYCGMYDHVNTNYFYYLIDQNPSITQVLGILVRLNITTGEKLRLDSSIIGTPQLNKSGWFVYQKGDLKLYKIKSNGDSLTLLKTNDRFDAICWSYDDKFIFYADYEGLMQINKTGQTIDTLPFNGFLSSKITNKIVCSKILNNKYTAYFKNLDTQTETNITDNLPSANAYFLNNNDTYLYCFGKDEIFRVETTSGSSEKILNNCRFNKEYAYPTLSLNRDKIVVTRYDRKLMDDKKTIYYEANLYEISLDGKEVKKLVLP